MAKPFSYETLAVVIPAFVCALLVRAEVTWQPIYVLIGCIPTLLLCLGFLLKSHSREAWMPWFVLTLAALPWGWDWLGTACREIFPNAIPAEPNELLALGSLANIVLGLACANRSTNTRRTTVFASMMLTIFCIVMVPGLRIAFIVNGVAFLQAILIVWWLMGDYWERLEGRFIGPAQSTRLHLRAGILGISIAAVVLASVAGLFLAPRSYRLGGFVPTSGGSRWSDDRSTSGLGDGNKLVGAKDFADSFGPVDTNLFIEDKMPSLYDISNEMNGDVRKRDVSNAAVSVEGAKAQMNHSKLSESEKTGREFSVVREQPRTRNKPLRESHSSALFHYQGEVPQRLAMATYANFDGEKWTNPEDSLTLTDRGPWLRYDTNGKPWIGVSQADTIKSDGMEQVAVRWLGLNSNRVTTPDLLEAIHIDRVDRTDFFAWTSDDVLEMVERERIPIFTTIAMQCQCRPNPFTRDYKRSKTTSRSDTFQPIPSPSSWKDVAESWTQDCGTDREKVDAILAHLRSNFLHDPSRVLDQGASNAIESFLHAKRGPAYLFATTASCMLKELGFKSRVATGFFVDSDDYDRESSHYAATAGNLHWWVQIQLDDGRWLSLEPTPGYGLPREHLRWQDRMASVWNGICKAFLKHPWRYLIAAAILALLGMQWRICLDVTFTMVYCVASQFSEELGCTYAMWLLEKRAALAGVGRPISQTPKRWFMRLIETSESDKQSIQQLIERQNWIRYAPAELQRKAFCSMSSGANATRVVLSRWTVRNMRAAKHCPVHSGA
jgi:protein-glutamine gamma-glutamyltransferase